MSGAKKVVVVGAGPSGRFVVKHIKDKPGLEVTLVQAAEIQECVWGMCETLTGQKVYEQCSTSEPMDGVANIVYGVATGACDGKIVVKAQDGTTKEIDFDYLVCATGFKIPTFSAEPGQDCAERRNEVEELAKVLCDPDKHVVVAGGGSVGVEISGDILDAGKKNLTLVTPSDRLLPTQEPKYSKKALEQLKSRGATIMLCERILSHSETTVAAPGKKLELETISGKIIECDAFLPAYARGPRTEWLMKPVGNAKLPIGLLNGQGHVVVDEFLASTVYPKLYVLGACNSIGEPPVIANMDAQSQCIAKNLTKEKSFKYGGGMQKAEMFQLIGHKSYGFFAPEAMNVPMCISQCVCFLCGFPLNLLCPCVWCCIACGPCTPMMCGYCCSDAEGKGVATLFAKTSAMGLAIDQAGYNGVAKLAPQEMDR